MSYFNETRGVSYSEEEICCRYLSIDLPRSLRSPNCTGKFGQELKTVGIDKFPYGITLSELIQCGALVPSLYVQLPREYFDSWENFPECPRQSDTEDKDFAGMYACEPNPHHATELHQLLHQLLHPYDGELDERFKAKFQAHLPESFPECTHPNRGKYIPAEAYLPYWQVYALADGFYKYRHAESFLSPKVGKAGCLELVQSAANRFINKYSEVFGRISWYKTLSAGISFSKLKYSYSAGNVFELAQQQSGATAELLHQDLKLLLELDEKWSSVLKKYGCAVLGQARSNLTKDIYLVYEQLRLLDIPAHEIFEEFIPDRLGSPCTPLHDVLNFEWLGIKESFITFGHYYCGQMQQWGYGCTEDVFDSLIQVPGFEAWVRAFHDLHESINSTDAKPINFKQSRIVDSLIVMSVRTEIVLREMFRSEVGSDSDKSIEKFLKAIKPKIEEEKQKIIEKLYCKDTSKKTKLYERPDDLFVEIEKISFEKWELKEVQLLRFMLKFITARNYFAHHAYKDGDLSIQTSDLSRQVIESLLATLLFFQKYKISSGESC